MHVNTHARAHAHTHTHIYIYIYIAGKRKRERERERGGERERERKGDNMENQIDKFCDDDSLFHFRKCIVFSQTIRVNFKHYPYIHISIYKTLFNPLNLKTGIIPIRTNKIFKNKILNLNNPGKELNVNKMHTANNFL